MKDKYKISMRENFLKNIKGFFNGRQKEEEKKNMTKEPVEARVISFGSSDKKR